MVAKPSDWGRGRKLQTMVRSVTRFRSVIALIAAVAVIASSCGGGDDTAAESEPLATETTQPDTLDTSSEPEPEPAAEPEPESGTSDDTPSEIPATPGELEVTADVDAGSGAVEADSECPAGQHSHDGESCHPDETLELLEPALSVSPTVVNEGLNTFAVDGSGFVSGSEIWLLPCPLPFETAEGVLQMGCDADSGHQVDLLLDGTFSVEIETVVRDDFVWTATDRDREQVVTAYVAVEEPATPAPAVTTTTAAPATTTTTLAPPTTTAATADASPPVTTTTAAPAPTTTTLAPPVTTTTAAPAPTTTAAPAPTTTTTVPEPEPAEDPEEFPVTVLAYGPGWELSEPLDRCLKGGGWAGDRLSVVAGTTANGWYAPVVSNADSDPCERIMEHWEVLRAAETDRIIAGQYPCEYPAAYDYWPRQGAQYNGPALFVGCLPVVFSPSVDERLDDPAAEAERLRLIARSRGWPPNYPEIVEALWACYRDAVQGPPDGWSSPDGAWPIIGRCHLIIGAFGPAVRQLGVSPACAAEQMTGRLAEYKERGVVLRTAVGQSYEGSAVTSQEYDGDWSWANCATNATRLVPDTGSFTERCTAVVDAFHLDASQLAGRSGLTNKQVAEIVKTVFCDADTSNSALIERADSHYQSLVRWAISYGNYVAHSLVGEGSLCRNTALLSAAVAALRGEWIVILSC